MTKRLFRYEELHELMRAAWFNGFRESRYNPSPSGTADRDIKGDLKPLFEAASLPGIDAQPMETAPLDGTRVLIWNEHHHYKMSSGPVWEECYYSVKDERWCVWCGVKGINTTAFVRPRAWAPVPNAKEFECE